MSVVTLSDIKDHLSITSPGTDLKLQHKLDAAETTLAQWLSMGSTLASGTVTQRATGQCRALVLTHGPVTAVTSVTGATSGALLLADLDIDLPHGLIYYTPNGYTTFVDSSYTVVYTAGYTTSTLPEDLAEAVKELTRYYWQSQRGNKSSAAVSPEQSGYFRAAEIVGSRLVYGGIA